MSDSKTLQIKNIALRWGSIENEHHKKLHNLSPQLNIIMGPNASGKTTVARALRHIIWDAEPLQYLQQSAIDATAELGDVTLNFRWNNGHVSILGNGSSIDRTTITGGTQADRYHLSLHHLLVEDDRELARQINHEMMGGYNLQKAKDELHYTNTIKTTGIGEYKQLKQKLDEETELKRTFAGLSKLEKKIETLDANLEKIQDAKLRKKFLEEVLEYYKLLRKKTAAEGQLSKFDNRIPYNKLTGNEWNDLRAKQKENDELQKNLADLKRDKENLKKQQDELQLPREKPKISDVSAWLGQAGELERYLDKFDELRKNIDACNAEIEEQRKTISETDFDVQWHQPGRPDWDALERDLIELLDKNSLIEHYDNQISSLKSQIPDFGELPEESELSEVLAALKNIRLEGKKDQKEIPVSLAFLTLLAFGIIFTALAAFFHPGLAAILAAATIALIGYLYFSRNTSSETDTQTGWKKIIQHAGFLQIEDYSDRNIADAIDKVIRLKSKLEEKKRLQHQLTEHKSSLEKALDKRTELKSRIKQHKSKFGVLPEFDSSAMFYHFIRHWYRLHELKGKYEGLLKERNTLSNSINQTRQKLFALKNDVPELDLKSNTASIKKSLGNLLDRLEQHNELQREIERTLSDISHVKNNLDKINHEIEVIRKSFPPEAKTADIKRWCEDVESWQKTHQHTEELQVQINTQAKMLEKRDSYQKGDLNLTREAVQKEIARTDQQIEKEQIIKDQLNEAQKEINQAMDGRKMEELQCELQEAWWALYERREENVTSAAGHIMYELLMKHTQRDSMPNVLKAADDWFIKFTQGRYSLQVLTSGNKNKNPRFKAIETDTDQAFDLNELSSGTRVQLLLAVRLAYVEYQESGIKLPLIIDELLANSDDQRASQIIEALMKIAENGRQIFYFTAQSDEVLKWQSVSSQSDRNVKVNDFKISNNSSGKIYTQHRTPEQTLPDLITDVPEPHGESHKTYREKLQIPVFDPRRQPVGALHLWYIIEDTDLLYNLLRRNIKQWSQLNTLLKTDDLDLLTPGKAEALQQNMTVVNHYLELAVRGRAKLINEQVLEASGAISPRFWDEVVNKLYELNNDPEKLLTALDEDVANFRSNKIEELRNHLLQEEYLTNEPVLEEYQIQHAIQQFAKNYSRAKLQWVQGVIARIISET